ncbi:cell envelope integrity protein TolA [Faucicola atlantae]|uniref:Protein TolA n=1 Tax=Faucicola atlantae TaxID=34059 RepID=A0A1B8QBG2_9GAMM|nr:cell envelope integrity protein TolA [Moraxella atlantae]OBX77087.1 hypothetical protein A9306_01185 [Moraxella atlantae]
MRPQISAVYVPVRTPDYKTWALILSILAHVLLIGALVWWNREPPPAAMQTSLVTPEELAAIQSHIRANQRAEELSQSAQGDPDATGVIDPMTAMSHATPRQSAASHHTPPPAMQNLVEQQAAFDAQRAQYAEQADREFAEAQQAIVDNLNQQQADEQATLANYRERENSLDDIHEENRRTAEAYNKKILIERVETGKSDITKQGSTTSRADSGDSKDNGASINNTSSNAGSRSGSGGDATSYISQIKAKIEANWSVPANSQGKTVRASFNISPSGEISNIHINGGDEILKASLTKALQSSSPLPAPPADIYNKVASNNFTFTAE